MIALNEAAFLFAVGQLVRHQRYDYRGVIVDRDDHCLAPEIWYRSNRTLPPREAPWYHILVDDPAGAVTYAAESSLALDHDRTAIHHPLVDQFFTGRDEAGGYLRNDTTWIGWPG